MTQNSWNTPYPTSDLELLVGNTGTRPIVKTLSSGAGISITNNPGDVTITALGTTAGYTQVNRFVFTADDTYIPTTDMKYCDAEICGGGAGGAQSGSARYAGGGGGGGGYARKIFTSAQIGVSKAVTIGLGGAVNANGGTSSLGALISATGGTTGNATHYNATGGVGGTGIGGEYNLVGQRGGKSDNDTAPTGLQSGGGGNSFFGGGAPDNYGSVTVDGYSATTYGGGGGGSATTGYNAGVGYQGIVIITEYISENSTGTEYYDEITAATKTIVVNYLYGANRGGGVAFTLPPTATVGSHFTIIGMSGLWSIAQNALQYVTIGSATSTIGITGSSTATNASDSVTFVCVVADTGWVATSSMGLINVV